MLLNKFNFSRSFVFFLCEVYVYIISVSILNLIHKTTFTSRIHSFEAIDRATLKLQANPFLYFTLFAIESVGIMQLDKITMSNVFVFKRDVFVSIGNFSCAFFDSNLFAQFHLSRFFGTFFFYEFVIHSECTFTHRIRCISMPFGFCEVKITRRCVLMREWKKLFVPSLRCFFFISSAELFQCNVNRIWNRTKWHFNLHVPLHMRNVNYMRHRKNDEEFSLISIICLDLFSLFSVFFSLTFQIDRLIEHPITFTCTLFQWIIFFIYIDICYSNYYFHIILWSWLITSKANARKTNVNETRNGEQRQHANGLFKTFIFFRY